ncbi:MAG: mismatch-specific DNA-glycosylase [Cycloclasticus sp.]|nr:mismatch-specific DNA-glycosylase [Cycloclasticus sp.]MBQ0789242.1 mismatch-specific DNA-glycosylase [Cycloclasticus sp.]
MKTLPDLVDANMAILLVGLNPSIPSVKAGFYFANPVNRFWKALNGCGFFSETLEPNLGSCVRMQQQYRIGFTDLVKRPTAGCKDLKADDYRTGSRRLQRMIRELAPSIVWFHGKMACQKYLQYSHDQAPQVDWGLQAWRLFDSRVYISPNPSPANAAFSLANITVSYRELFQLLTKPTDD